MMTALNHRALVVNTGYSSYQLYTNGNNWFVLDYTRPSPGAL